MQNIKFLLVDDSLIVLRMVRKVLENRLGARKVYTAANGKEAIKILESKPVDLILSDWNMPEVSGEELLYHVRNTEKLKEIPFIMMSALGGRDFFVTAIQLGVTQYVVKPFTPAELEDKIRKSWNSASKRGTGRYSKLPKHNLMVKIEGKPYPGEVLNISRTGAHIKIRYVDELKLFASVELSIAFEKTGEMNEFVINPLPGTVIRLEAADSFHPTSAMCDLGMYFAAASMEPEVEQALNKLLNLLSKLDPEIIQDN